MATLFRYGRMFDQALNNLMLAASGNDITIICPVASTQVEVLKILAPKLSLQLSVQIIQQDKDYLLVVNDEGTLRVRGTK